MADAGSVAAAVVKSPNRLLRGELGEREKETGKRNRVRASGWMSPDVCLLFPSYFSSFFRRVIDGSLILSFFFFILFLRIVLFFVRVPPLTAHNTSLRGVNAYETLTFLAMKQVIHPRAPKKQTNQPTKPINKTNTNNNNDDDEHQNQNKRKHTHLHSQQKSISSSTMGMSGPQSHV